MQMYAYTYIVEIKLYQLGCNARLSSKTPVPGMINATLQVVCQGSLRDSQNYIDYCCCHWLPLRGSKSLLLKTLWTLFTGLRRSELDLTSMPPL